MRTKETHNDVIIAPHGLRRITIILQGKFTFCLTFNFQLFFANQMIIRKKKQENKQRSGGTQQSYIKIYWLGAAEFFVCISNKFFQALESAISELA